MRSIHGPEVKRVSQQFHYEEDYAYARYDSKDTKERWCKI